MWLDSQQLLGRLDMVAVPVLLFSVRVQETARDLGMVIDSRLSLSDHVTTVCRSGYYQLWQLQPVVQCSSEDTVKTMVQVLSVACTVYYSNALSNMTVGQCSLIYLAHHCYD